MSTNEIITVTKRDGSSQPLNLEKIYRVVEWAAEGLAVAVSEVIIKARLKFFDGIKSSDIHKSLIQSAADNISVNTPDYQAMAARLLIYDIRKQAYGDYHIPHLYEHVKRLTEKGIYDKSILASYTEDEFNTINEFLDHERDYNIMFAGACEFRDKYLAQDRVTKRIYEHPQFCYILIGMCLFAHYDKSVRLDYIKRFYDLASQFYISLSTPIMAGVRTPTRQFSSCVVIHCDDSLDSITEAGNSIISYVSRRAGIGLNIGPIRSKGDSIRNGEARHTGIVPFVKYFESATTSCSQGGVRGGAATLYYPAWRKDVEELIVLKNNGGTELNRARFLDYGIQFNNYIYDLYLKDDYINLFSTHEVPGLYDAFFKDPEEWKRLYEMYSADESIPRTRIKVSEIMDLFIKNRGETGRVYVNNVDNTNQHGPFISKVAPVYSSNLCAEIALPTKPVSKSNPEKGEIALCTLSAINLGKMDSDEIIEDCMDILVRILDSIIDYQDYPLVAAEKTKFRRSLGIGIINYAYWLVKNGYNYDDRGANNLTHKLMEKVQYFGLKASNQLAKEVGKCEYFHETRYSLGELPIDWYNRNVDSLHDVELEMDWESLRKDIVKYGLRNSTITALMPSESSSRVSNATNGIEPPNSLMVIKKNNGSVVRQLVPEIEKYYYFYQTAWNLESMEGYLTKAAIMQKFVDQAISANTYYDAERYPNKRIPGEVVMTDILLANYWGLKTLYYHNTATPDYEVQDEIGCAGGACKL